MYLNTLKLRANSVNKHIEKLVKEGLAEVRGNTICATENLRTILTATGDDRSLKMLKPLWSRNME
jgi:hypothetical protein